MFALRGLTPECLAPAIALHSFRVITVQLCVFKPQEQRRKTKSPLMDECQHSVGVTESLISTELESLTDPKRNSKSQNAPKNRATSSETNEHIAKHINMKSKQNGSY